MIIFPALILSEEIVLFLSGNEEGFNLTLFLKMDHVVYATLVQWKSFSFSHKKRFWASPGKILPNMFHQFMYSHKKKISFGSIACSN